MWKHSLIGACVIVAFALPASAADKVAAGMKTDAGFANQISMHHQMGIEMAQLCQRKAEHSELKAFCAMSSEMQSDTKQLAALSGGSKSASQSGKAATSGSSGSSSMKMDMSSMPPEMKAMHDQHHKAMQKLNTAQGSEFDRQFAVEMARHHRDGEKEFQDCQTQASGSDLRKLCGKMASSQQKETKQLQQWQTAWGKLER